MEVDADQESRPVRLSIESFLHAEHLVYIAIGALLVITAVGALLAAVGDVWHGLGAWRDEETIPQVIERLLFVLMIAEILHTVRVSIRSGSLICEPFLIVGLIASIRRVLVITLESSQATRNGSWTTDTEHLFRASMIELGVLAVLILVMVASIRMLRARARTTD